MTENTVGSLSPSVITDRDKQRRTSRLSLNSLNDEKNYDMSQWILDVNAAFIEMNNTIKNIRKNINELSSDMIELKTDMKKLLKIKSKSRSRSRHTSSSIEDHQRNQSDTEQKKSRSLRFSSQSMKEVRTFFDPTASNQSYASRQPSRQSKINAGISPILHSVSGRISAVSASSASEEKFNYREIGLFWPHMPDAHDKGEIVTSDQDTYFRDVWLFLDQVKTIVVIKDDQLVRTHLHTCLRGDVQTWYADELTLIIQTDLRGNKGLDLWIEELSNRFKLSEQNALNALTGEKYTMKNIRLNRSIVFYIQSIVRYDKSAEWTTSNQLNWAWCHLAPTFQRDISQSDSIIIMLQFIQLLQAMKTAWKRYYINS